MTTEIAPTIKVTVADDHRRSMLTFHKPGCAHTRSLDILHAEVDHSRAYLRMYQAEAKDLGVPNPIAPCLRKAIQ